MSEQTPGYSVYLFDQAVEALGEPIRPYLREGADGVHIACREVDTGGSFVEMTIAGADPGRDGEVELMIPLQMVRMIVSSHSEAAFGFAAKNLEPGLAALPPVGPAAPAPRAPSTATPHSEGAPDASAGIDDRRQPPEG